MRLIDADALIKNWVGEYPPRICGSVLNNIWDAPTIDVADRLYGSWIRTDTHYVKGICGCSECGAQYGAAATESFNFCPHCGAYMRKDKDNEID